MSEHESLPNPLPEDPQRREEIEFATDQMRQQEVSERGFADQDLDLGKAPQEVLQDLGGVANAADIIGPEKVAELHNLAVAGPSAEVAADDPEQEQDLSLMNKVMEKDAAAATAKAYQQVADGMSAEEVIHSLGGTEEAKRIIGEAALADLQKSDPHRIISKGKGEQ